MFMKMRELQSHAGVAALCVGIWEVPAGGLAALQAQSK